jgi:hypothetical protein
MNPNFKINFGNLLGLVVCSLFARREVTSFVAKKDRIFFKINTTNFLCIEMAFFEKQFGEKAYFEENHDSESWF